MRDRGGGIDEGARQRLEVAGHFDAPACSNHARVVPERHDLRSSRKRVTQPPRATS